MLFKKKINFKDPLLVEKQEQIFYIQNIKRGDIIFDVGANIGELTLLFSRFAENGQVHSFEPTPTTFEKLSSIIKCTNNTNIKLNNLAVSNKSGFIHFNIYEEEFAAWNTMANRPLGAYGINVIPPKSVIIPTVSIDDYCSENGIEKIDLLKIDVEGAELNVLKGAEGMFSEKKIKVCVFEFGQTIFDMGNTVEEFKQFFKKYNYKIGNVSKNQHVFPIDPKTNWGCFSVLYAKPR